MMHRLDDIREDFDRRWPGRSNYPTSSMVLDPLILGGKFGDAGVARKNYACVPEWAYAISIMLGRWTYEKGALGDSSYEEDVVRAIRIASRSDEAHAAMVAVHAGGGCRVLREYVRSLGVP